MKNFVEVIDYFFGIKNPCTDNRNEVYSPECSGNPFCFFTEKQKDWSGKPARKFKI